MASIILWRIRVYEGGFDIGFRERCEWFRRAGKARARFRELATDSKLRADVDLDRVEIPKRPPANLLCSLLNGHDLTFQDPCIATRIENVRSSVLDEDQKTPALPFEPERARDKSC